MAARVTLRRAATLACCHSCSCHIGTIMALSQPATCTSLQPRTSYSIPSRMPTARNFSPVGPWHGSTQLSSHLPLSCPLSSRQTATAAAASQGPSQPTRKAAPPRPRSNTTPAQPPPSPPQPSSSATPPATTMAGLRARRGRPPLSSRMRAPPPGSSDLPQAPAPPHLTSHPSSSTASLPTTTQPMHSGARFNTTTATPGDSSTQPSNTNSIGKKAPVLLVDGYGMAYRVFWAYSNSGGLRSRKGVPTSVTKGVLKTLKAVVGNVMPSAVIVALDGGRSFRRELGARLEQLLTHQGMTDQQFVDLCKELRRRLDLGQLPLDPEGMTQALQQLVPAACRPALEAEVVEYSYKAGRRPTPVDFSQDIRNLRTVLQCMRIPCYSVPHIEADDILSALAKEASRQGYPVRVITPDQDLLQLVDDEKDVKVLLQSTTASQRAAEQNTGKPFTEMCSAGVREKISVPPHQFVAFRGMVGDKSDNIPGVPKIGEKTAEKLLSQYGSVPRIFEALDRKQITGATAKYLSQGRRQAAMSVLLTQLLPTVPLDNGKETADLFQKQGFLMEEVQPLLSELDIKPWDVKDIQVYLGGQAKQPLPPEEVQQALEAVRQSSATQSGVED